MGIGQFAGCRRRGSERWTIELGDREDARVRANLNPNLLKLVSRAGRNSGWPLFRYLRTVR